MIKFCLLLLSLILPITSKVIPTTTNTTDIESFKIVTNSVQSLAVSNPDSIEAFNDLITENYDSYGYLLIATKKEYDVMVITGIINNNTYYGIFINNKTNNPMKAFLDTVTVEYNIYFNDHIASYPKLKLDRNKTYEIKIIDTISGQPIYDESFTTDGNALSDIYYGYGNNQLTTQKLTTTLKPLPTIQIVSIVLIVIFGFIIIYILVAKKNRNVRYHHYHSMPSPMNSRPNVIDIDEDDYELFDYNDGYDDDNDDEHDFLDHYQTQEPPKDMDEIIIDKETYINHLFKLYEQNEITEEVLNEELKKIWWKK